MNLLEKRIVVTGGKGFLGQHLIRKLRERGCKSVFVADLPEYNLVQLADIQQMHRDLKPDVVIHLAAKVGGIGFNQDNPATLFYENAMMGIQLIHEAYLAKIEKFVALGTICAYPKYTPVPFNENDIWNGYPEETNAPYGLAKKMMLVQSQAYRQQYGFNSIFLLPVNLYGPGDNFSFKSSHVIPALIRKFHLANLLSKGDFAAIRRDFLNNGDGAIEDGGKSLEVTGDSSIEVIVAVLRHYGITHFATNLPPSVSDPYVQPVVEIWGTGKATREFFYVEDAADSIVLATELYDRSDPVNIGAGFEISIKELVDLLARLTEYKGRISWDKTKPDGQPRRMLDVSKAENEFGFTAKVGFEHGLRNTIEWYVSREIELV
jgi:GDP-L-fucose synthase